MPSLTYTPALLALSVVGIEAFPVRVEYEPAAMRINGADFKIGPDLTINLKAGGVDLDRLTRGVPIGGAEGPSMQFQAFWQRHCEAIEAAFKGQQGQIDGLEEIVAGLRAAQEAAAQANRGVETINETVSLSSSRTDPVDGLLTATSGGVVTVAPHDRVYPGGAGETRVSVAGGTVSGFSPGDFVRIYYSDAAREGGAVSYLGTTSEVSQVGDTHVVGGVSVPQVGSPPAEGIGTTPPGYVRLSGFRPVANER